MKGPGFNHLKLLKPSADPAVFFSPPTRGLRKNWGATKPSQTSEDFSSPTLRCPPLVNPSTRPGKLTFCNGKSPFLMGKSTINGHVHGKITIFNGKSPFLMGKSTISMAIFDSYVKLPKGNYRVGYIITTTNPTQQKMRDSQTNSAIDREHDRSTVSLNVSVHAQHSAAPRL